MSRITLIHWNPQEAAARAAWLGRAGHTVACLTDSRAAPHALRENPPDVFVIDLSRIPSHGREIAVWLRQQQATRRVPIIFVQGDPDKTQRIRELLPDAVYAEWSKIRSAIKQAIRHAPAEPVVVGTFDSYSGAPLPKKLGIRAGAGVALLGAPKNFEQTLGALPENVRLQKQARGPADVILLFVKSQAELEKRFDLAKGALAKGGKLWIVWPKQTSGVATDLTQIAVRAFGLGHGLVDFKICAIDATWSGLCFVRRSPRRRA
jgi:CheY-like chemotaxis protein